MGIMNKLNKMKNFLFDEEDDEKEIKKLDKKKLKQEKENKKDIKTDSVKEENDGIEELYFEDVSEENEEPEMEIYSRSEKNEGTFNFPEFDDEDFMVSSNKPEPIIPTSVNEEPPRILYQGSKRKEETKKFRPSPIISPIYGLLDSEGNSVKEDSSSDKNSSYNDNLDEVRKKAYGTIDDETQNTLKKLSKKTIEEAEKEMEKEEKELSREKKKESKVKEEIPVVASLENDDEDEDDDMILPNVNFKEIDVDKESGMLHEEESENHVSDEEDDEDDTKEQDLFNLIDTMYQNKEEE